MDIRIPRQCRTLGLFLIAAAVSTAGPLTPLFLTDGDSQLIWRIDGNHAVSWNAVNPGEYPIAVNSSIRTMGVGLTDSGAEYGFGGSPTGSAFSNPFLHQAYDGTSDGRHNYSISLDGFAFVPLVRFDLDWQNPVPLFPTTYAAGYLGIAFDALDGSFWMSAYGSGRIDHWSGEGQLIDGFSTGLDTLGFLALDPADHTLWTFYQGDDTHLYQFSVTGEPLGTTFYAEFVDQDVNLLGGEFGSSAVATPEPQTLILTLMAVVFLYGRLDRKRRVSESR